MIYFDRGRQRKRNAYLKNIKNLLSSFSLKTHNHEYCSLLFRQELVQLLTSCNIILLIFDVSILIYLMCVYVCIHVCIVCMYVFAGCYIFGVREISKCINLCSWFYSSTACVWNPWISATAFTLFRIYPIFLLMYCLLKVVVLLVLLFFSCTRLLHTYTIVLLLLPLPFTQPFAAVICNWHLEQYPFLQFVKQCSYFRFPICVV